MTTTLELDPATGVTVLGYNRYHLEAVRDKFYGNLAKIENTLDLKIESTYTLVDSELTIHAIYDMTFTDFTYDACINGKTTGIGFRCSRFPFILPAPSKSVLTVVFDKYFNISYVEFKSMAKQGSNYTKLDLVFNKKLDLESISFQPSTHRNDVCLVELKKAPLLSALSDEALLFKLYLSKNEETKELLPEYHIPSAYDFSSQDFTDRLSVFSMLTF